MERRLIRSNEIYLARFPFGDKAGMKLRPVLVLTEPIGPFPEVLVAYISSVVPHALLPTDLLLDPATSEHQKTNLKTKSVVRLHKLATIHVSSIARRLGTLPNDAIDQKNRKLVLLLRL